MPEPAQPSEAVVGALHVRSANERRAGPVRVGPIPSLTLGVSWLPAVEVFALALGEIVEAGVLAVPPDLHRVDRAVALLGDDELRDVPVRRFLVVVVVAVDEADVVGVLLDGARLAEVRELRALALLAARLDGAVELRERDDREAQLLRQLLQPARDLADLLLARVRVRRARFISCR